MCAAKGRPGHFLVVLPLLRAEIAISRPFNCSTRTTTYLQLSNEPKIVECGRGYSELCEFRPSGPRGHLAAEFTNGSPFGGFLSGKDAILSFCCAFHIKSPHLEPLNRSDRSNSEMSPTPLNPFPPTEKLDFGEMACSLVGRAWNSSKYANFRACTRRFLDVIPEYGAQTESQAMLKPWAGRHASRELSVRSAHFGARAARSPTCALATPYRPPIAREAVICALGVLPTSC